MTSKIINLNESFDSILGQNFNWILVCKNEMIDFCCILLPSSISSVVISSLVQRFVIIIDLKLLNGMSLPTNKENNKRTRFNFQILLIFQTNFYHFDAVIAISTTLTCFYRNIIFFGENCIRPAAFTAFQFESIHFICTRSWIHCIKNENKIFRPRESYLVSSNSKTQLKNTIECWIIFKMVPWYHAYLWM